MSAFDETNLPPSLLEDTLDNLLVATLYTPIEVIGYHGCTERSADIIVAKQEYIHSKEDTDWLGDGFYFWEYAPHRAEEWADIICKRADDGSKPAVIRATIRLGRCLNLLDIAYMQDLAITYPKVVANYETLNRPLPRNTATGAHRLDRQVVNLYCKEMAEVAGVPFQTVRGCFPEGKPIYPDSKILGKTHVQIAVRDDACILEPTII